MSIEEQHAQLVKDLAKSGDDIHSQTDGDGMHLIHMCLGIAGEAGEVVDHVKTPVIHDLPIDTVSLILELGDLAFYLQGLREGLGIYREEVLKNMLSLPMPDIGKAAFVNNSGLYLMTACTGLTIQSSCVVDIVKKHIIYSKPLDTNKLILKMGYLEHYTDMLMAWVGVSREEVLQRNIEKLTKRYPKGGYTDKDAIAQKDAK